MNLYINIPYKTGKHKNETENTNFIRLYIKISISFFFLPHSLRSGLCSVRANGVSPRVPQLLETQACKKVKTNPYRYNLKLLASKMRIQLGTGVQGPRKSIRNQSTFINGAYKLASSVFNTSFFSSVCFDLIFLSLNIQKSALAYIN